MCLAVGFWLQLLILCSRGLNSSVRRRKQRVHMFENPSKDSFFTVLSVPVSTVTSQSKLTALSGEILHS